MPFPDQRFHLSPEKPKPGVAVHGLLLAVWNFRQALPVVARLKENLPALSRDAERRFHSRPPDLVFRDGPGRVELWDADDFDSWESLEWETVRVIRYRQYKPDGDVVEAYWLTNFSARQMSRRCLYAMTKSRWRVENQGFNDAKNRYGLEHIRHHQERSLLLMWLLTCLALSLERLSRLRYLHRGVHPVRTAIHLLLLLVFGLIDPCRRRFQLRSQGTASFSPREFFQAEYGPSHRRRWIAKFALRKARDRSPRPPQRLPHSENISSKLRRANYPKPLGRAVRY